MSALETRLAIVEAYDSGLLQGNATAAEIAKAVGSTPRSVGKALIVAGFRLVQKATPIKESIPTRWAPPRNFPKLTSRHNALTRAVAGVWVDGLHTGRCYAYEITQKVNSDERSVTAAFKRLGFKVVKRRYQKSVGWQPAIYAPPYQWPPKVQKEVELRRAGLSVGQVGRAMELAAEINAVIDAAVMRLDSEDIALNKPGQMKAKIRSVIYDSYHDSITRKELANRLGEASDANVEFLLNRVGGYVTFASRRGRVCLSCGADNTAKL